MTKPPNHKGYNESDKYCERCVDYRRTGYIYHNLKERCKRFDCKTTHNMVCDDFFNHKERDEKDRISEEPEVEPEDDFNYDDVKYKQVILVNMNLKMGVGKTGAQCGHAAVNASLKVMEENPLVFKLWMKGMYKKVVLKSNKTQMQRIKKYLDDEHVSNALIIDAGLTEIPPNSITTLGIGPAPEEIIDLYTRGLSLLK